MRRLKGFLIVLAAVLCAGSAHAQVAITQQPQSQSVVVGQSATFTVTITGGPCTYKWLRNGVNIANSNSLSYTTPLTRLTDNGAKFIFTGYNCKKFATLKSNPATLTVTAVAPILATQPANQSVTVGQSATFSVTASGTTPLSYQWRKNGVNISGAKSANYTTPITVVTDNGSSFTVVVSNSAGSLTSSAALLTVNPPPVGPTILAQPANQTVIAGQTATFSVSAGGTGPLNYQWEENGASISGAVSANLKTSATTSADNGATFSVGVSNPAGSVTSSAAMLTVNPAPVAPTISAQPVNQTVTAGQTATFLVTASGTAPLSYQWQNNGTNIAGATSLNYTTPTTTNFDNGSAFQVIVSNSTGSVTSNAAVLTVNAVGVAGPLRPLASNPRYFTDGSGKAIFLAGSHTWSNGMEDRGTINPPLPFDFNGYMSFMLAHNFNWMRMWTTEMSEASTSNDPYENIIAPPYKWVRSSTCCANDGGNLFDLTTLDQSYFDRMRARIIQAGQNGIYVSVMLFNGYMWQLDVNFLDGDPFESTNNINLTACSGTCPSDNSLIPADARTYQQTYLQKVVDTVNDLPNVMYEVSNEAGSPYSDTWQASVISFVKQYEGTKPFQHPVGMTFQYRGGSDTTLYNSQGDWVSTGTTLPPVATGNKVIINDTDHSYSWSAMKSAGQNAQMEWAWENFTEGNNLGFMDPYLVLWTGRNACTGTTSDPAVCTALDPYWDELRNALTDVRNYSTKIDLANMTPQYTLSTSGYCIANSGSQYLVFSTTNSFTLTVIPGTYTFEWFNPTTHTLMSTGSMAVNASQSFTAPFTGDSVLWLHQ